MKPTLYIMVGYPGSGKTTVAQYIHAITGARHVWASQERKSRFGEETYNPDNSTKLYDQLNQEVADTLSRGESVIFDTNFRYKRDREKMKEIASEAGANYMVIWVQAPREVAEKRAVEDSDGKPTRLWGNMPQQRFERLAGDFDLPTADENPVIISGVETTEQVVRDALANR